MKNKVHSRGLEFVFPEVFSELAKMRTRCRMHRVRELHIGTRFCCVFVPPDTFPLRGPELRMRSEMGSRDEYWVFKILHNPGLMFADPVRPPIPVYRLPEVNRIPFEGERVLDVWVQLLQSPRQNYSATVDRLGPGCGLRGLLTRGVPVAGKECSWD